MTFKFLVPCKAALALALVLLPACDDDKEGPNCWNTAGDICSPGDGGPAAGVQCVWSESADGCANRCECTSTDAGTG